MNTPIVDHPTDRPNFYTIKTDKGLFWYSYKTCIAYRSAQPSTGLVIRKNDWNVTTGKHLNYINSDKSVRVSGEAFEKALTELEG